MLWTFTLSLVVICWMSLSIRDAEPWWVLLWSGGRWWVRRRVFLRMHYPGLKRISKHSVSLLQKFVTLPLMLQKSLRSPGWGWLFIHVSPSIYEGLAPSFRWKSPRRRTPLRHPKTMDSFVEWLRDSPFWIMWCKCFIHELVMRTSLSVPKTAATFCITFF